MRWKCARLIFLLVAQLGVFCFASPAVALLYRDDDSSRVRACDRALAWSSIFSFLLSFSQLSRPGHTDLQPPHAPSAGTRGGGEEGRLRRTHPYFSRHLQRRTDGEITLKHTRLRIFVHDPPSRQPLFSAASHIWAPFRAQVALRIAVPPCFASGLGGCSAELATVHFLITGTCGFAPHPPSLGVPPFHQTIEHSCERRTLRPGLPSERAGQIYSERRFN